MDEDLNQYWKTVVNTIQDGIMIVTPDGKIVSVNEGLVSMTGYSRDELIGASCTILGCSSCELARGIPECHWCVMFKKGELRKQQCALMRKDGSRVPVVKNASVLKDRDGEIIGAVETMTDISDLVDKEQQLETFRREISREDSFHGIVGRAANMQQVFDFIDGVAQIDSPVIIHGESGTGKELVAKAIHEAGPRRDKPFIKVNCAALNESLLESELFGHVKGAYTGAHKDRMGRFESAGDGDIFLDEIGDLPASTQVKLLRVLEEKVIERVGDHKPIPVQARILTATNRDLPDLIARNLFRQDLYYRINVIPIRIPPLRERREDIPLLASSFFLRMQLKSGKKVQGISREAMDLLLRHPWPGNVRELRSAFEYAFVACKTDMIEPRDLPTELMSEAVVCVPADVAARSLDEIKKERLVQALREANGNQSEAARILGISRTSVWSQMKRYNVGA
ncbi:PAS domain S-box-containing protein [Desulfomicrobium apsheronum]|uniref:PAS domain S-box-containing protein n=1 Tax=Desulfomicrobium apsheronum TaxID=52560 RepID=A0A1I3W6N6_9BACT|nr:sigma 54-interacting transcriptional regulator [Desulfomicrobium apsheronum]MDY0227905.1 sigma 54-interacting transcriptional regulator [Desulfomicrobium apsheronum]SFK03155.1 PAS domain S-box-containing protein [Desulfomicrobium apsheronum]